MSDAIPTERELLKRVVFVPCETKEDLHRWIDTYLGINIPTEKVAPESTGSPMDTLFELYDLMRKGGDPKRSRYMVFASRDSYKTFISAILEVLALVHLDRPVVHAAAIEEQAGKAQEYVRGFFNRIWFRDFVVGDNKRDFKFVRYEHKQSGENITQKAWSKLPEALKPDYVEYATYIKVVTCTMAGMNGQHAPLLVLDEVDIVANKRAYAEGRSIPCMWKGQFPLTLLISTRKTSTGMVQKELDAAADTGLHVRHWNILDVTEKCPPSRHLPDEPRIPIYYSEENLRALDEDAFALLPDDVKRKYQKNEGYRGCLKNCKLFASCRGRQAQRPVELPAVNRPLLKNLDLVEALFRESTIEYVKAQYLCWQPGKEGMVYPNFDRRLHQISAAKMAEMITGEEYPPQFTKAALISLMRSREMKFFLGMDFGYTHNFSVTLGAVDGHRMFILDLQSRPGLELAQQIELCQRYKPLKPVVYADPAYPGSIKSFHKDGFLMRDWSKKPHSVVDGIQIVRMKLLPGVGEPQLFLLKDDEGCDLLAKRFKGYAWTLDADGRPTDTPDDEADDEMDAMRYMVMNVFDKKGKVSIGRTEDGPSSVREQPKTQSRAWFEEILEKQGIVLEAPVESRGRKGNFCWDL